MHAWGTDSVDDEWFGQGMAHMALWIPCRNRGLDWAWELGHVFGTRSVCTGFKDWGTGFVSRDGCGEDDRFVNAVLPDCQDLAKGSLARGKASGWMMARAGSW